MANHPFWVPEFENKTLISCSSSVASRHAMRSVRVRWRQLYVWFARDSLGREKAVLAQWSFSTKHDFWVPKFWVLIWKSDVLWIPQVSLDPHGPFQCTRWEPLSQVLKINNGLQHQFVWLSVFANRANFTSTLGLSRLTTVRTPGSVPNGFMPAWTWSYVRFNSR